MSIVIDKNLKTQEYKFNKTCLIFCLQIYKRYFSQRNKTFRRNTTSCTQSLTQRYTRTHIGMI